MAKRSNKFNKEVNNNLYVAMVMSENGTLGIKAIPTPVSIIKRSFPNAQKLIEDAKKDMAICIFNTAIFGGPKNGETPAVISANKDRALEVMLDMYKKLPDPQFAEIA